MLLIHEPDYVQATMKVMDRIFLSITTAGSWLWLLGFSLIIGATNDSTIFAAASSSVLTPYYTPGAPDYLWSVAGDPYIPVSSTPVLSSGPSTSIPLNEPQGLFVTSAGDIYIADTDNFVVRFVNATTGIMSVVAGNGKTYSSNNVPPLETGIYRPTSVWVGESAAYNGIAFFFVDINNNIIRKVTSGADSKVITIVGTESTACPQSVTNNMPGTSTGLCYPVYVVGDTAGNLYFSELGTPFKFIRKLTQSTNLVTIIAGTGYTGYNGNNIAPLTAMFNEPTALWLDEPNGVLYINDRYNYLIRAFNLTGNITNVAGIPKKSFSSINEANINNQPTLALNVTLNAPNGVWGDNNGNIYITNSNYHFVQKVNLATGIITNVVGTGGYGYSNNIPPLNATLSKPWAVFYRNDFLYLSCDVSNVVQVVYPRIQAPTSVPTPIPNTNTNSPAFDNVQTPLLATLLAGTLCAFFASILVAYRNQVNAKEVRRIKGLFGIAVEMFLRGLSLSSLVILMYICLSHENTHAAGYFLILSRGIAMLISIWIIFRTLSKTKSKTTKSSAKFTKDMMAVAHSGDKPISSESSNPLHQFSADVDTRTTSATEDNMLYMNFSNIYKYKFLYFVLGLLMIFNVSYIKYLPWYRSAATGELNGYPSVALFLQAEFTLLLITLVTFITVLIIFYVSIIRNQDLTSDFAYTTVLVCLISMGLVFILQIKELSTVLNLLYKKYLTAHNRFREKSRDSTSSVGDFKLSNITSVSLLEKMLQGPGEEDNDDNDVIVDEKIDDEEKVTKSEKE